MAFRIRQIDYTVDGREIVRERDVAKTELLIGRAAECDIHLPDLGVELQQAVISELVHGRISIRSIGSLGFAIDGKVTAQAELASANGGELHFGGHRISIGQAPDGVIVLTVQRVEALSEASEDVDEKHSFSLASLLPGKRPVAWTLAVLILVAFLAVPIFSNLSRGSGKGDQVIADGSWSSGPLSLAHHALEGKCEACHVRPFESVRDEACLSCHKDAHEHAPAERMDGARATPGLGGRFLNAVAHSFGKTGPGSCVECHSEHEGKGRMQPVSQQFCADCHATLDERLTKTKLGNASDFGTLHPQFKPLIATSLNVGHNRERLSLDGKPQEMNGLRFPHKLHLNPIGGVARMAESLGAARGYGKALACKDCHQLNADGVRFRPVEMERNCEACHSLAYDQIGGTIRTLRHGDVAQMMADLQAVSRNWAPARPLTIGSAARRRPGDYAAGRPYHATFGGAAVAQNAINNSFSRKGVCGECHIATNLGGTWKIAPVTLPERYLMKGWFDHKAHRQEKCESCHAAGRSSRSSDVLLPALNECRTCHLGESSHKADVPSGCAMCHDFHQNEGAPWASGIGNEPLISAPHTVNSGKSD